MIEIGRQLVVGLIFFLCFCVSAFLMFAAASTLGWRRSWPMLAVLGGVTGVLAWLTFGGGCP